MIPRYQRIAFWILLSGTLLLALVMLRGCVRDHEHAIAMRDLSPIPAPVDAPDESVSVATANDADGTLTLDQITLPLPTEPSVRAHVLLDRILADDAGPNSAHPLPAGTAIADVFFLRLPLSNPADAGTGQNSTQSLSPYGSTHIPNARLAVVDFTKAFGQNHPSSIAAEDLTLRQIIATLHANFPDVEEVRFLIDGQSQPTLAGHAPLDRPYPVNDPARQIHPLSADGSAE